jgi:hypothetical protein
MAEVIKNSMVKRGFTPSVITATIYGRSVISARRKLRQAIGRGIRQLNDMCCVWFGDRGHLTQDGKLNLASCLPTRFCPALKTASTFTLDRVVQSKEQEEVKQPQPITWPKQRFYI